jgi:hypothetical protein
MITGIFNAIEGSQRELTAGELLGITNPNASVVG